MRLLLRYAMYGCLAIAGLAALLYAADELSARFRGKPTDQIKVDRFYAAMNRWNQIEYSIGAPFTETCVEALLPHFGYSPCWYVRRHTLRQIGNP